MKLDRLGLTFELESPFEKVEVSGHPSDPTFTFYVKGGATLCFKPDRLSRLAISIERMLSLVNVLRRNVSSSSPEEARELNDALIRGTLAIGQHGIAHAQPAGAWQDNPNGVTVQPIDDLDRIATFDDRGCLTCGDTVCVDACPAGAIHVRARASVTINDKRCTGCGDCVRACPEDCLELHTIEEVIVTRNPGWCVPNLLNNRAWPTSARCGERCAGCGGLLGEEVRKIREGSIREAIQAIDNRGLVGRDLVDAWMTRFARHEVAVRNNRR